MLVQWIGVSHRVGRVLCCWILIEKGKVLSLTTVQHLTVYEPRDPNVKERTSGYHGSLESALVSEDCGTSLDLYNPIISDDEEVTANGDPNE